MDQAILNIIPPLAAAILTYVVANKRARIQHAKLMADIQGRALETVASSEEKMRKEMWAELDKIRKENSDLQDEVNDFKTKLSMSEGLVHTLKEEISALRFTIEAYERALNVSKIQE